MKKQKKIKYIVEFLNPKTKKWKIDIKASSFEKMAKKLALNWQIGYYTKENGKLLKLRIKCVEMSGSKITRDWEEFKLTKGGKVYGYFTTWEKMGKSD